MSTVTMLRPLLTDLAAWEVLAGRMPSGESAIIVAAVDALGICREEVDFTGSIAQLSTMVAGMQRAVEILEAGILEVDQEIPV